MEEKLKHVEIDEKKSSVSAALKVVNELPIWHLAETEPSAKFFRIPNQLNFPFVYIRNLLSKKDCENIIEFGRNKLQPSTTIRKDVQGIVPGRTSLTAYLNENGKPSPYWPLKKLQLMISGLLYYPLSHMEAINLTYYPRQTFFREHHDYLHDEVTQKPPCGDRVTTCFVYLNTVPELHNGKTIFPRLGLEFQPTQGDCVFWPNTSFDGTIAFSETLHEGETLLEGEKWGLNIWIRQNSFLVNTL